MNRGPFTVELISDLNLQILADYLENDGAEPQVSVAAVKYGQVISTLLRQSTDQKRDLAVVWTSPASVIPGFADALQYGAGNADEVLAQVREFARSLIACKARFRSVLVCLWTLPPWTRGYGLLDRQSPKGLRNLLLKMNSELISAVQDMSGIYVLDPQDWLQAAGRNAYAPKSWYLSKMPFGGEALKRASEAVKSALRTIHGQARKLLVVDLDDTLWGGVVGDVGWEKLRLGGHDYVGEAYCDFQRGLKALRNRGVLLGIVSKNEETIALEALRKHPEMILRVEDFAGWRINWHDKAENTVALAGELNLGLQSVVFIDDNPVERARVREALPEVLVLDWPSDKTLFAKTLGELDCFDTPQFTVEDSTRGEMYLTAQRRDALKQTASSVEDWLASLKTKVSVEELNSTNWARVVQLFNKTNQMNLATRRLTDDELSRWLDGGLRKMFTFRVADRFGDSGLTGILSLEHEGEAVRIVDFILSCRVMGRKIEETMLAIASQYARRAGATRLLARYVPTAKNQPCHEFLLKSGLTTEADGEIFSWDLAQDYPVPSCVATQITRRPELSEKDAEFVAEAGIS